MKTIRLLAITPYEGLRKILTDVVQSRKHIDMQVFVGDLDAGVKLAIDHNHNYDIILSRGGTAKRIREFASLPVVDIKLSEYDILHAIRLAQSSACKFAVVGFDSIIERVASVCKLLDISVDTYVIGHAHEIAPLLGSLKQQQYSLVVGDAITSKVAPTVHMNSMLITSGKESVLAAIDEVELICCAMAKASSHSLLTYAALDCCTTAVLAYDEHGSLLYANQSGKAMEAAHPSIISRLLPHIPKVLEDGSLQIVRRQKGQLWYIDGVRGGGDKPHAFFYARHTTAAALPTHALSFQGVLHESSTFFGHFHEHASTVKPILDTALKYASTALPVLLLGEPGTGKDSLAWVIHKNSSRKSRTLLTINCRQLTRKSLARLLHSENSPLHEMDGSFYFKNLHCLDAESQLLLVRYIQDTSLHSRSRVIYASEAAPQDCDLPHCLCGQRGSHEQQPLIYSLLHEGARNCASLILPSLRECRDDIASLSGLFIHELNIALGSQVAGLDAESVLLLQDFPWRYNVEQLIRVLRELVITADDVFIHTEATARVLAKESRFFSTQNSLPLCGTLDEITAQVIQAVLVQENMNQTQAARRLGISRSTMWRYCRLQP